MELERAYIEELVAKLTDGTLTESELQTLIGWYNSYDDSYYAFEPGFAASYDALKIRLQNKILAQINPQPEVPIVKKTSYSWLKIAAAVLMVAAFGLYFFLVRKTESPQDRKIAATEILPGYNQAILTLADGSTINLDSAKAGIQVKDETIVYNDGDSLELSPFGGGRGRLEDIEELTLSTPRGGQYQIILSDGTKVWLNAASTLKYPNRFSGDARTVELEGEAYFSVNNKSDAAGDRVSRVPFIIKSKNQETTVLGTEFNISAYADEKEQKTTLVTGAIQVASHAGPSTLSPTPYTLKLAPGEQSTIQSNGKITKAKVDVDSELSWREGAFSLQDKTLKQVMREVARWYDIEVVYEGTPPTIEFFGSINRNKNLSSLLRFLESSEVSCRLEGRRLIVESGKEAKR